MAAGPHLPPRKRVSSPEHPMLHEIGRLTLSSIAQALRSPFVLHTWRHSEMLTIFVSLFSPMPTVKPGLLTEILTTGATAPIAVWSNVEMGLAITAASLATLRPLVRTISASLGFSSSGGPSGPSGGPSHALNGTAAGSSAFDRSRSRTKRQLTRNEEDHDSDEFIDMTHFADHSTNAWAGEGNAAADHMSKIMITKETEVTVTSLPSDSSPPNVPFWKRKGSERDMSDNESQEVLRMEGTDDATKEHRPVVPKSFLPKRDGNQTQN